MTRGKASGISLATKDASVVLGMVARGDREHDIAAWFGVNQGRIKEAKDGKYGTTIAAPPEALPPKGPPGLKGRRLKATAQKALDVLIQQREAGSKEALGILKSALEKYEESEI